MPAFFLGRETQMQSLESFMSRLQPHVQGCPAPLAHQALIDSAIEFCDETCVVTTVTDAAVLRAGQFRFDIDLTYDLAVSRVLRADLNGRSIPVHAGVPPQHMFLFSEDADDRIEVMQGYPERVYVRALDGLVLPAPDEANAGRLHLLVATRPRRDAQQLDDALLDQWAEAVVAGATQRLCLVPGQPYTDATKAGVARMTFLREVSRGRLESRRTLTAAPMQVAGRPFA